MQYTTKMVKEVKRLYEERFTHKEIVERTWLKPSTVKNIISRHVGAQRRKNFIRQKRLCTSISFETYEKLKSQLPIRTSESQYIRDLIEKDLRGVG